MLCGVGTIILRSAWVMGMGVGQGGYILGGSSMYVPTAGGGQDLETGAGVGGVGKKQGEYLGR